MSKNDCVGANVLKEYLKLNHLHFKIKTIIEYTTMIF